MYQIEEHLAPLPGVITNSLLDESSSDNDSSVEVTSIVDENEYELIKWTNYLQFNSDLDDDSDDNYSSTQSASLVNYSSSESSSDDENLLQSSHQAASSNNNSTVDTTSSSTSTTIKKRKRRQWTVNEKLNAIVYFEKNNNKSQTASDIGCATKQLRKKRTRRNGAGERLTYVDLDSRLLVWYRQKRTDPGSTTTPVADIRKEKVTFRYLQRRGRQLSQELNHPCPSSKWFGRFLVRHRLSLQRPKRQQKFPLAEVHQKATSFYNYLRRASRWAPKRGPMGAFTPRDVFDMDESPLALFGDQAKRSINDINTCNEVEGCLSNKRFCTVILTVSGEDQRVDPVLTLQNYTYDPSVINCVSLNINDDDDEEQIQNAATLAAEQHKIILNEKNKQLKFTDLWKK
ncbi:unnamed protein product [Adineta steineri]|uniref:HTH psq-type domain-containing protein n=1 Tax=Adineta steineri TaxID=433720 RepID=A0A816ETE7_9BILA|nr:unnamed protein product [Adineta steineri]CAF1653612.1 unnamed protein product [Adineta steineri]